MSLLSVAREREPVRLAEWLGGDSPNSLGAKLWQLDLFITGGNSFMNDHQTVTP